MYLYFAVLGVIILAAFLKWIQDMANKESIREKMYGDIYRMEKKCTGKWSFIELKQYHQDKLQGSYKDLHLDSHDAYDSNDIGRKRTAKMQSGNVAIYKLISCGSDDAEGFGGRNLWFDLIGYEGLKPIRECTFEEFIDLYAKYF